MDYLSIATLPEGAIPLTDLAFLRGRHFHPALLRKPFITRLRPALDKAQVTRASEVAAAKYREILIEDVFLSATSLLPFFSLQGGDETLRHSWAQVVRDNVDLTSLLDNISVGFIPQPAHTDSIDVPAVKGPSV